MTRIVIVGGDVPGLRTAEALRDNGFDGELVGIGAEVHPPYARPPLSKSALHDSEGTDRPLRTTTQVRWHLGVAAAGLDLAEGLVELTGVPHIGFDAVVIATGLRVRRLPGATMSMTLRTVEEADRPRGIRTRFGEPVMSVESIGKPAGCPATSSPSRSPRLPRALPRPRRTTLRCAGGELATTTARPEPGDPRIEDNDMRELWRASRQKQVRGWQLAARVAIGLCCQVLVPALDVSATRRSLHATISATATPPCAKPH